MRSSRRYTNRAPVGIDLTSMVDVVFLLVIFFMVSTTFITLESGLPVDLPQAQSPQSSISDLPTVTITKDLQIYLSGAQVAEADLTVNLRTVLAQTGLSVVVLRADKDVPHGTTVKVMDLIKQAGAQRIAIATGGG
ncbi:MAG: biopolymer transporter ExbD [Trueperaceae bacterium]|nr:biopolymer transporter ExbD [Trueperaceae bacterium]